MATEIAVSFSTLRDQLENEKSSLYKIDENIKKIVQTAGRYQDRNNKSQVDYGRGGPRLGARNSYPDMGNIYNKNEDIFNKRKHETKTVFSRLSGRAGDSDGEEGGGGGPEKRARMPSAVWRSLPTRASVLRAQSGDEAARTRNRRIFGSLLGTLHKFKQEEITLQTKEEKKAQVERKIEEQARQEKEREQRERKTLFAERDHKKATIKTLEAKLGRVHEFEKWEESQKCLGNFILTKAKPHVYWLPKKMTNKATEKLLSSRKFHEKCMERKREELQEELKRIEQRCARPRGPPPPGPPPPGDDPAHRHRHNSENMDTSNIEDKSETNGDNDRGTKKRDKFAMDGDEVESDTEERREEHGEGVNGATEKVPSEDGELIEPEQVAASEGSVGEGGTPGAGGAADAGAGVAPEAGAGGKTPEGVAGGAPSPPPEHEAPPAAAAAAEGHS